MNNNNENELGINLKVDHNDHAQSNLAHANHTLKKTARLAKFNFLITVVGLGTLSYLHFTSKSTIDESLAKSKVALKNEISKDMSSKEDLQLLSADLATKMESQATRISSLELQDERFQEEIGQNTKLIARLNELQNSAKKSKPAAVASKGKPKAKAAPKASKKGKK